MFVNLLRQLVIVSPSSELIFELCPLLVLFDLCTHRLPPLLVFSPHLFHLKLLHVRLVFLREDTSGQAPLTQRTCIHVVYTCMYTHVIFILKYGASGQRYIQCISCIKKALHTCKLHRTTEHSFTKRYRAEVENVDMDTLDINKAAWRIGILYVFKF